MRRPKSNFNRFPQAVARRILARGENNEPVVLTFNRGIPSRVFGLDDYRKMQEHPKNHKPWNSRATQIDQSRDPLGSVNGNVRSPLTREKIYDE